jgi:hypothetical protein
VSRSGRRTLVARARAAVVEAARAALLAAPLWCCCCRLGSELDGVDRRRKGRGNPWAAGSIRGLRSIADHLVLKKQRKPEAKPKLQRFVKSYRACLDSIFLPIFGGETQESARIPPNSLCFCEFSSPWLLYQFANELKHTYS